MAQAKTDTSTTLSPSSRRGFRAQAASVAAGGAVVGMALSPLTVAAEASQRVPDPILAAIEAHKIARAAYETTVTLHSALDRELPIEKCLSRISAWEETIVAMDNPRWIDIERAMIRCLAADTDAACTLINVLPTTMSGVAALLRYTVEADPDGEGWPQVVESDDGQTRSWRHFLIANLAEILPALSNECA